MIPPADHPNIPAAVRIQGETDSFGCEMIDMCTDCFTRYQQQANQHSGTCDWCKTHAEHLRARRDMDEGTHGPVYYVCTPCVVADNKRINDERDNEHNDDFFDED